MVLTRAFQSPIKAGRSYLRAPVPLHFPVEELVPETGVHLELRTALYMILRSEFSARGYYIGSDQFLYWDPTNPKKCLAPDVMVRLEGPDLPLRCLKVWEGGAPQLAVEIVSDWDDSERDVTEKLERYRQSGVSELVRFDPTEPEHPLRLWDRLEGDLVERALDGPLSLSCDTLGLYWHYGPDARLGCALRLARDPEGRDLLATPDEQRERERLAKEAERSAKEAERSAKEAERSAKEAELAAKEAALARIAELEAELRRR